MDIYTQLDAAYHHLARTSRHRHRAGGVDLDAVVAIIRDDIPDSRRSDETIRSLLAPAKVTPDSVTVVLHALAPRLRRRISSKARPEFHANAVADLTFRLLAGDLTAPGLAHRLVNRAHNRTHREAQKVLTRGQARITTVAPLEPADLADLAERRTPPTDNVEDKVIGRLDLARFAAAITSAVDEGVIPADVWATFRDQRLRRELVATAKTTSHERATAHRAARRIAPYINTLLGLHAA